MEIVNKYAIALDNILSVIYNQPNGLIYYESEDDKVYKFVGSKSDLMQNYSIPQDEIYLLLKKLENDE
jgi:hypothetical protein